MTFLTNKRPETLFAKQVTCSLRAISAQDILNEEIPSSVVIDLAGPSRLLNDIVRAKKLQYMQAPIETAHGNIVYVVQDNCQNILILQF